MFLRKYYPFEDDDMGRKSWLAVDLNPCDESRVTFAYSGKIGCMMMSIKRGNPVKLKSTIFCEYTPICVYWILSYKANIRQLEL